MQPNSRSAPILRASGITRRFGGLVAVSDVTFEVGQREILGLIGPNGAGKSTIFNLISGFYKLSDGRLEFDGKRVEHLPIWQLARLGLVRTFQHDSLLKDMTVRDNILVGVSQSIRDQAERERRIAEMGEIFGLLPFMDELARHLPHGHQRMLSMAIAFSGRPKLLCLDEPLTGFNQTEVNRALETIRERVGFESVQFDDQIGKLSLVGAGMRSHPGVTATFCEALADAGVNIEMISTSEIRISALVRDVDLDKAVKALHDAFELGSDKVAEVHAGTGR